MTNLPDPGEPIALLRDLVACDSINPPGHTTGAARLVSDWLHAHGLTHEVIVAAPEKSNIVARLDNGAGPHLIFNAHLDTVLPGDETVWSVPPLALSEREGRLYGLGTGNMKAAVVAMLFAYRGLAAHPDAWSGRLTLTLVADECVFGPDGAAHLLARRADLHGDMLICGEGPGAMQLAPAEKGLMWVRLHARGRVGQGMLTQRGGSATARLAVALAAIDGWNDVRVTPPLASLDHPGNGEGLRLSANVGRIAGGGFISQAADHATAEIDFRLPCGMTMADIAARLDRLCRGDGPASGPTSGPTSGPAAGLSWEPIKGWEPNWSSPDASVARAVRDAACRVRGSAPADVTRLPASDASRWRALGIPAVCFGPQPELASGVDDHVNRADFLDCIAIYGQAALALLPRHTAE